jgi:hypothetical protein
MSILTITKRGKKMTIKEKIKELKNKNSWNKWSKEDKSLYLKLIKRSKK